MDHLCVPSTRWKFTPGSGDSCLACRVPTVILWVPSLLYLSTHGLILIQPDQSEHPIPWLLPLVRGYACDPRWANESQPRDF